MLILLGLPATIFSQVRFYIMVSEKQPDRNQYIQVDYTVENGKLVEKIVTPVLKNFKIIQGPSQSSGMTYINGEMTQSKSLTYILQPLSVGKVQIPGTTALVDGKTMQADGVMIDVKKSGGKGNTQPVPFPGAGGSFPPIQQTQVNEEYVLKPGESFQQKVKNNLFVKGDVNKTTCYEGEPIVATFSLFSRLKSESRVTKRPSMDGFSVYDMIDPEGSAPTVQTIGGKSYNVHLIRQTQLFPLQAGTFTIDPVELENSVRFVRTAPRTTGGKTAMQQLMDDMMNDGVSGETEDHNFTLASKPITITVKPLPMANKPAGFNGAVGKFSVKQVWKGRTVAAGDAFEMELTLQGEGNFSMINTPAIDLPASVDSYDPAIKEDVDKTHYPLSGSKTFSYTFIPRDTGHITIPGLNFSYFDPLEEQYKTVSTDDVMITVTKGQKKSIFNKAQAKTTSNEPSAVWDFFDEYKFVIFTGSALVALTIIGLYKRAQKKRRRARRAARAKKKLQPVVAADTTSEHTRIAPQALFSEARSALDKGHPKEFYGEVNRSLWRFISERLQIPSTDLNKYNVANVLKEKGVEDDKITDLQNLLNECEIAIYTPVHDTANMTNTLNKAEALVTSLRSSIS